LHRYLFKKRVIREALLPSFYKNMTFKEKVNDLLAVGLSEKRGVFLIDLTITDANKIIVTLDGDSGVVLQDCIDISRAIEHNLDREEQDFSLEVASVGVGSPLKLVRQYINNIGRTLIVKTETETIEAQLVDASESFITLTWEAREPKKIGKGKETVQKRQEIAYDNIEEAVVTVTF
jgi:ribosome maturation factor RimP